MLMDIRMPSLDGVAATKRLTSDPATANTRVLILTTFDADQYVHDALCAGASGFLLKDVRAQDLLNAVKTIAAGDALLSPQITRRLIDHYTQQRSPSPQIQRQVAQLTPRETELLLDVARGERTPRSPPSTTSRCRQPRPTSATFSPSSTPETESSSPSPPTKPASCTTRRSRPTPALWKSRRTGALKSLSGQERSVTTLAFRRDMNAGHIWCRPITRAPEDGRRLLRAPDFGPSFARRIARSAVLDLESCAQ